MIKTKVNLGERIRVDCYVRGIEEHLGEVRYSINILLGEEPRTIIISERDLVKGIVDYPERKSATKESSEISAPAYSYINTPGQLGN